MCVELRELRSNGAIRVSKKIMTGRLYQAEGSFVALGEN